MNETKAPTVTLERAREIRPSSGDPSIDVFRDKCVRNFHEMIQPLARYRETVPARLDRHALEQLGMWLENPDRNLVIAGTTGMGKSRLAWLAVKRLMTEQFRMCFAVTELQLAIDIGDRAMAGTLGMHLDTFVKKPFLFIDDIGKAPPTERFVSSLNYITECRYASKLPLIVTTQLKGADLEARLASREDGMLSHAAAIIRRISEGATLIHMKEKPTQ